MTPASESAAAKRVPSAFALSVLIPPGVLADLLGHSECGSRLDVRLCGCTYRHATTSGGPNPSADAS